MDCESFVIFLYVGALDFDFLFFYLGPSTAPSGNVFKPVKPVLSFTKTFYSNFQLISVGGVYALTQLGKMLLLATFFPTVDSVEEDPSGVGHFLFPVCVTISF